MEEYFGHHAVVIGGSLAGLMTARVLADHFDTVTVIERDGIKNGPTLRRSIPQGSHLHTLLLAGQQVMASLYPRFLEKLETLGAVRCRAGRELVFYLPTGKAFSITGTVRRPRDLGFDIICQSRGLLEYCVRQCTSEFTNIRFENESAAQGLIYENGRIRGVRYHRSDKSHVLDADFVVDAGGRRSAAPRWLQELGFHAPEETTIRVDIGYASTKFCIPAGYHEPERVMLFVGPPPDYPNGAIMEVIENNTWHVTLAGRFGNYPPHEGEGFFAFAQSLHTPKLSNLIKDADRIADITHYRFPTSVQRHYERLASFPEGFLVLGDAISSFNPFYGQGMSSTALQVQTLQQLLTERASKVRPLENLALSFFERAAEIILTPWTLAANQDFAYPQTQGERPSDFEERIQYFMGVDALTAEDPAVHRLLFEVLNLAKPLAALREEPLRSRVQAHRQKRRNECPMKDRVGRIAEPQLAW
jgi:2-polyprenyl-6-methoxyphenol hydroxylase-like FAD-dependent oxidoreductase